MKRRISGHRRGFLSALALLGLFAAAFLIRAAAFTLPALPAEEKPFFQDENGNPYLTEMDSYFYARKAREMAEQGIFFEQNRSLDPLMGAKTQDAPAGTALPTGLSALAAFLAKILAPLGVSLAQVTLWLGPVLGSLAMLPAFFFVRRRAGTAGGLAAAALTAFALPFALHTFAGFFDTDMLLAMLPLSAVCCLIGCLTEENRKRQAVLACGSAVSFGLLSLCWAAYYGYVLLALAGTALFWLFLPFLPRERRKQALLGGVLAIGLTLGLLALLHGGEVFSRLAGALKAFREATGRTDSMPYALEKTVEMQPPALFPSGFLNLFKCNAGSLLGWLGGLLPCALAVSYFPLRLWRCRREADPGKARMECAAELALLGLWTVAGLYLAHRAVRLAQAAVLPVCVLAGLQVGQLFSLARDFQKKPRLLLRGASLGLAVCCAFVSAYGSRKAVRSVTPRINDSLQDAMTWVRNESGADTVLASWWDDGYYLEYQGERRTLADGGTDNGKVSFFLAKALLTEDPALSAGILRMLSESGTDALDRLVSGVMDQARAAKLLLEILPLSRAEAAAALQAEGLPAEQAGNLLEKTHPENPDPLMLVLGTYLSGIPGALAYFAYWDPEKEAQTNAAALNASSASAVMENGRAELATLSKNYNRITLSEADGTLSATYTDHGEEKVPVCFCLWEDGVRILDERPEEADGTRAVVAVREGDRVAAVLCSEHLCDSMLVRLLFCEDRTMPGMERAGTWYADEAQESCAAQRRVLYARRASWAAQVWRVDAYPVDAYSEESAAP